MKNLKDLFTKKTGLIRKFEDNYNVRIHVYKTEDVTDIQFSAVMRC